MVDKFRRAKEQLKTYEKENERFKEDIVKYKKNKEHLVARLHDTDLKLIGKAKVIKESADKISKLKNDNASLLNDIQVIQENENHNKSLLVSEISNLKSQIGALCVQKSEIVSAFEDICCIFDSFSLKI